MKKHLVLILFCFFALNYLQAMNKTEPALENFFSKKIIGLFSTLCDQHAIDFAEVDDITFYGEGCKIKQSNLVSLRPCIKAILQEKYPNRGYFEKNSISDVISKSLKQSLPHSHSSQISKMDENSRYFVRYCHEYDAQTDRYAIIRETTCFIFLEYNK